MENYRNTLFQIPPGHPSFASNNILLLKDDVARAKPTTRKLPHINHTYGFKPTEDQEGVREVISTWKYHQHRPRNESHQVDNRVLNKMAIACNIHTVKDLNLLRRAREDVRVCEGKFTNDTKKCMKGEEDVIYGRKNRTPSPMGRILSNAFGREGQEKTALGYAQRYCEQKRKTLAISETKNTKLLRSFQEKKKVAEAKSRAAEKYQMKRFQGVASRVYEQTLFAPHTDTQVLLREHFHAPHFPCEDGSRSMHGECA